MVTNTGPKPNGSVYAPIMIVPEDEELEAVLEEERIRRE